nr:hypothetical protein [Tanacetum cinerariifolium]
MSSITAQQTKLDLELVPNEKRLEIRKCNGRLNPGKKQREPTFYVVLDALALTPCYSLFLTTADLPKVYMHQFWDTIHKDIFQICPRFQGQNFDELSTDEEIVSFFKELGHTREIKSITDAITYKKNVDYVELLWKDFTYQINNRGHKKQDKMYYPRFTKVIIHQFLTKDKAISKRNKIGMHTSRDDYLINTLRFVFAKEESQIYGARLPKSLTSPKMRETKLLHTEILQLTPLQIENQFLYVSLHKELVNDNFGESRIVHLVLLFVTSIVNLLAGSVDKGFVALVVGGSVGVYCCDGGVKDGNDCGMTVVNIDVNHFSIDTFFWINPSSVVTGSFILKSTSSITSLEKEVVELKKNDPLNTQVTALVDEHLDSILGATRDKFMSYLLASITARITEQVETQLPQILPKEVSNFAPPVIKSMVTESLEHAVLAKESSQPKSIYEAAASLTEFKLKKILINKMDENQSYLTAAEHRECYDGLIKSYDLDKSLFSTYDKVYSLKRS